MALSRLPVLVTRPRQQADSLCDGLEAIGCEPVRLPMLDIVAVAETPQLKKCFLDIDLFQTVIAISRNAAEAGLDYLDQYWPQFPVGIDWIAVGPVTAKVMKAAGMEVKMPAERYDSEGALALDCLQADKVAGKKILIWRGVGGRETLASILTERGAQVEYAELYERNVPQHSDEQWQLALQESPLLVVSSGQGLEAVAAQQPRIAEQVRGIIAPSARVADIAQSLGFSSIQIAASAQDNDMIAAIQQWQQNND
jgi:uroporphyrinogen-III synthase